MEGYFVFAVVSVIVILVGYFLYLVNADRQAGRREARDGRDAVAGGAQLASGTLAGAAVPQGGERRDVLDPYATGPEVNPRDDMSLATMLEFLSGSLDTDVAKIVQEKFREKMMYYNPPKPGSKVGIKVKYMGDDGEHLLFSIDDFDVVQNPLPDTAVTRRRAPRRPSKERRDAAYEEALLFAEQGASEQEDASEVPEDVEVVSSPEHRNVVPAPEAASGKGAPQERPVVEEESPSAGGQLVEREDGSYEVDAGDGLEFREPDVVTSQSVVGDSRQFIRKERMVVKEVEKKVEEESGAETGDGEEGDGSSVPGPSENITEILRNPDSRLLPLCLYVNRRFNLGLDYGDDFGAEVIPMLDYYRKNFSSIDREGIFYILRKMADTYMAVDEKVRSFRSSGASGRGRGGMEFDDV